LALLSRPDERSKPCRSGRTREAKKPTSLTVISATEDGRTVAARKNA